MKRSSRVLVYDRYGDSHDSTNGHYVSHENTAWFEDGVAEGCRRERERQAREMEQRLLDFKIMRQRRGVGVMDRILDPVDGGLRKTRRPAPNASGKGSASPLVSALHLLGLKSRPS
jgi:hypothetical protein